MWPGHETQSFGSLRVSVSGWSPEGPGVGGCHPPLQPAECPALELPRLGAPGRSPDLGSAPPSSPRGAQRRGPAAAVLWSSIAHMPPPPVGRCGTPGCVVHGHPPLRGSQLNGEIESGVERRAHSPTHPLPITDRPGKIPLPPLHSSRRGSDLISTLATKLGRF